MLSICSELPTALHFATLHFITGGESGADRGNIHPSQTKERIFEVWLWISPLNHGMEPLSLSIGIQYFM